MMRNVRAWTDTGTPWYNRIECIVHSSVFRSATGSMLESWDSSSEDSDSGLASRGNPYEKQSSGGQWWETGTQDSGQYDWQNNNWQQRNDTPPPPLSSSNGSGGAYATRRGGGDGRRRGDGGRRR